MLLQSSHASSKVKTQSGAPGTSKGSIVKAAITFQDSVEVLPAPLTSRHTLNLNRASTFSVPAAS